LQRLCKTLLVPDIGDLALNVWIVQLLHGIVDVLLRRGQHDDMGSGLYESLCCAVADAEPLSA